MKCNSPLSSLARISKTQIENEIGKKTPRLKAWTEGTVEISSKRSAQALVVILPTTGCRWGLCTMCGYTNDSLHPDRGSSTYIDELKATYTKFMQDNRISVLKIFNSGSFWDPLEISKEYRREIIENIPSHITELVVECRPDIILKNEDALLETKDLLKNSSCDLVVGVGLESSNDFIRCRLINKGFLFSDFLEAVNFLKKNNIFLKTYILLKPPFLTEKESINDVIHTTQVAERIGSDCISLNPVTIHKNTAIEVLWKRGLYTTPWIWSILDVQRKVLKESIQPLFLCEVVAGGSPRGPHNCGKCDNHALKAVEYMSQHQTSVDYTDCDCYDHWKVNVISEGILNRSQPLNLRQKAKGSFNGIW